MTLLMLGVLLWSVTHLFPTAGAPARKRLIGKVGEQTYKGVFALTILASIVMMVFGWRGITPTVVYLPSAWGYVAAELLVLVALVLFVVSGLPSNLKRAVRHPQLSGLVVWSAAHLLANGDHVVGRCRARERATVPDPCSVCGGGGEVLVAGAVADCPLCRPSEPVVAGNWTGWSQDPYEGEQYRDAGIGGRRRRAR